MIGHLGGIVQTSQGDPQYIGAAKSTAFAGELSGMAWGYAVSTALPLGLPIVIHCDCTAALANALRPTGGEDMVQLSSILSVSSRLAVQCRDIQVRHVKGHSGHPWNEYADRVANQAIKDASSRCSCPHPLSSIAHCSPHRLQWACEVACLSFAGPVYPRTIGTTWYIEHAPLPEKPFLDNACAQAPPSRPSPAVPLSLCQANVLTLQLGKHRLEQTSPRIEFLDKAFFDAGLAVVFAQETRTPGPTIREQSSYFAVASGCAPRGVLGCEIWLARTVPDGHGGSIHIDKAGVVVCHSSPRILYITVSSSSLRFAAVSAHAPTSCSPRAALAEFWKELESVFGQFSRPGWPLIVGIDGNAKVGSVRSPSVGPLDPDEEDFSGACLRRLADKFNLVIPTTFPETHSGASRTWEGCTGQAPRRIDYVLVPASWLYSAASRVDSEIDITTKRRDHYPVVVTVRAEASESPPALTLRRKAIASRSGMSSRTAADDFIAAMSEYTPPAWTSHAHDHHYELFSAARSAARYTFPIAQATPRKTWLSQSTWDLMRSRSRFRSTLFQTARDCKIMIKRAVFYALRRPEVQCSTPFHLQMTLFHWTFAAAWAALIRTEVEHKNNVEADRTKMITDLSLEASSAAARGDSRTLFQHVKLLSPKSRRAQHAICTSTVRTATARETRRAWQQHFAAKLAGVDASFPDLLARSSSHQQSKFEATLGTSMTIDELPSISDLCSILAALRRYRGHGEDALPGELFRVCPSWWSKALHPIIIKAFCRLQEPLAWKGGMLAEIYKGSGERTNPANSRAVLVEDSAAKVYHAWLRRRLLPRYLAAAHSSVYGGVPRRGTAMCAHQSMAVWEFARGSGLSAAQLYVDIVGAFDAVIRQLVFGASELPFDDEGIARIVAALGLPPEVMHHIADELSKRSVLEEIGVPPPLLRPVAEAHAFTWFSTQGLESVVEPRAGSRPGDPLGDIIFNLLESYVHRKLTEQLAGHPAILHLPPLPPRLSPSFLKNEPAEVLFNNYVDDDAFSLVAPSAYLLVGYLREVASIIFRTFLCLGLPLNFKENKTEAVISLVGHRSREVLRKLIMEDKSVIAIPSSEVVAGTPDIYLRVVAWYRHMGICSAASGGLTMEAKVRAGAMFTALKGIRSRVINNKHLDDHTKLSLCSSLLFSRLFFGAELWHDEPAHAITSIMNAYITPVRDVLGLRNVDGTGRPLPHSHRTSNAQVLVAAELPTPIGRARASRVRYWCRLVYEAPHTLLRLVLACHDMPGTWSHDLASDLHICWSSHTPAFCALPDPRQEPLPWIYAARERPRGFARDLVKAMRKHYAPAVSQEPSAKQDVECNVSCPDCDQTFPSYVVMCCHRTAKHGYVNPLRRHVSGTVCSNCHVQFHSYARLYHHVRNNLQCKQHCLDNIPPMDEAVAKAIMTASLHTEKAKKSKELLCPCVRP